VTTSALSYAVWALIGAAAAGLWWASATGRGEVARPVAVVGRLATGPLTRVVLVLVVMFAGWHLFAR
jgi:hypothetical protein